MAQKVNESCEMQFERPSKLHKIVNGSDDASVPKCPNTILIRQMSLIRWTQQNKRNTRIIHVQKNI